MKSKSILGLVAAGALTIGLAGVAVGEVGSNPKPVSNDAVVAPPQGQGNHGAEHQNSSAALREHLERSDSGYLKGVDWSTAQSFAVPGTSLRGWTFEHADGGKRCLAIPDPLAEGYGVTCNAPSEVARGEATVVMLPPVASGAPNVVGALVSGEATARISGGRDASADVRKIGDVYAGTAPAGSRLVVAGRSQSIEPPTDGFVEPAPAP